MNSKCVVGVCSSPEHCKEIGRCFSSGFAAASRRDRQASVDAARYRWLCKNRDVMLITGFFGNGCTNRTINDVSAVIDADLRNTPTTSPASPGLDKETDIGDNS